MTEISYRLRQAVITVACITAFVTTAVAAPAVGSKRSDCGQLDDSTDFNVNDELLSCNGRFLFTRKDGMVSLIHKPSGSTLWQHPDSEGAKFAFYTGGPEFDTNNDDNVALAPNPSIQDPPSSSGTESAGGTTSPADDNDNTNSPDQTQASQPVDPQNSNIFTNPLGALSSLPPIPASDPNSDTQSSATVPDSNSDLKQSPNIGTNPLVLEPTGNGNPSSVSNVDGNSVISSNLNGNLVAQGGAETDPLAVAAGTPTNPPAVGDQPENLFLPDTQSSSAGIQTLDANAKTQDGTAVISTFGSQPPDLTKRTSSTMAQSFMLRLEDSGNMGVYQGVIGGTDGQLAWKTDTDGSDCDKAFIERRVMDAALQKIRDEGHSQEADFAQTDPCLMVNLVWDDDAGYSENPDSIQNIQNNLMIRAKTKKKLWGRTVVNQFKLVPGPRKLPYWANQEFPSSSTAKFLTDFTAPPSVIAFDKAAAAKKVMGTARLSKTWFWDGKAVQGGDGKDPPRAVLTGEVVDWTQWIGLSWQGISGGSDLEKYDPDLLPDHSVVGGAEGGRFAHSSLRTATFNWKLVALNAIYTNEQWWRHELYIRGFANGKLECRGGHNCLNA